MHDHAHIDTAHVCVQAFVRAHSYMHVMTNTNTNTHTQTLVQHLHIQSVGKPGKDPKAEFLKTLDDSTVSQVQALHVQVRMFCVRMCTCVRVCM